MNRIAFRKGLAGLCVALVLTPTVLFADIIDDLEDGDNQNNTGNYWWYVNDSKDGGTSTVTNAIVHGDTLAMTPTASVGRNGGYAAECSWKFGVNEPVGCSGTCPYGQFVTMGVDLAPEDSVTNWAVTATTIKFWAKANISFPLTVEVGCKAVTDYGYHMKNVNVTTNWSQYTITLSNLTQPAWAEDKVLLPEDMQRIQFKISADNYYTPTTGTLYIDDVEIDATIPPIIPAIPQIIAPPNNAQWVTLNPDFIWKKSKFAATYNLQLSENSNFQPLLVDLEDLSDTVMPVNGLSTGTDYYWRVQAVNSVGTSNWDSSAFTTTSTPAKPSLSSPANLTTVNSLSPVLRWLKVPGAVSYKIEVSDESLFSSSSKVSASVTDTFYNELALVNNKTYYWRVSATNSIGTSSFSNVWSFTTPVLPGIPQLSSPANNKVDQAFPVTLSWSTGTNADSHVLQISKSSTFASGITEYTGLTTSKEITTLDYSTKYYWRVQGVNDNGTGIWSTVYNFTTQIAPPAVPVLSSPANNATGLALGFNLAWQAVSTANHYHAQVSSKLNFSDTIFNHDSLSSPFVYVNGLSELTTYYWRVRAYNNSGSSTWSTARIFTTGSLPAAPVLVSPAEGTVSANFTVKLLWRKIANASTYTIYVARDDQFQEKIDSVTARIDTSFTTSILQNNTTYYWKVAGENDLGVGSFSEVRSFSIQAPPQVPVLSSPVNNVTITSPTVDLGWSTATGASSYTVQVSEVITFNTTLINDSSLTVTHYSLSGLEPSKTYYWRVKAKNSSGSSAWTSSRIIKTIALPAVPSLTAPVNDSLLKVLTPTLSWSAVSNVNAYTVELATDSLFSNITTSEAVSGATFKTPVLSQDTIYYWRVHATNDFGDGPLSAVRKFKTPILVGIPSLVSPEDESVVPIPVQLTWSAVSGAQSYSVQVATNSGFTNPIISVTNNSTASYIAQSLQNSTTYYWRVKAKNAAGEGVWSDTGMFTTEKPLPGAPQLVFPADAYKNDDSLGMCLSWKTVALADSYSVQVCTTTTFTNLAVDKHVKDTVLAINNMANNVKYYWRVAAINSEGASNYAAYRYFTIFVAAPAPTLKGPQNQATDVPTTVTFNWTMYFPTNASHIQVSTNQTFTGIVLDSSGFTNDSLVYTGLSYNKTYYWRVQGSNETGFGAWSTVRSFTTKIAPPSAPILVSPKDSAQNIAISTSLIWKKRATAVSYSLQVSKSANFSDTVCLKNDLTDSICKLPTLENYTTYYWRVNATNVTGTSDWSLVRLFKTIMALPDTPSVISTSAIDTLKDKDYVCIWNKVENNVTKYGILVCRDSKFTDTAYFNDTLKDTSVTLTSLENNKSYYWKVRAYNAAGWGRYSSVYKIVVRRIISAVLPKVFSVKMTSAALNGKFVKFDLPVACNVNMTIFDCRGKRVKTCALGHYMAGSYTADVGYRAAGKYVLSFTAGSYKRIVPFISY